MPSIAAADTDEAYAFFDDADCLGTAFTSVPTQPKHDSAENVLDIGGDWPAPIGSR